jgi:hypothetical protein
VIQSSLLPLWFPKTEFFSELQDQELTLLCRYVQRFITL